MLGMEFQPGSADQLKKNLNQQQPAAGNPGGINEVLKVLSLRLPKVLSGSPIAPAGLLNSLPHSGATSALTTQLGGSSPAPTGSPMPPGPSGSTNPVQQLADNIPSIQQIGGGGDAPPPNFVPGGDNAPHYAIPDLAQAKLDAVNSGTSFDPSALLAMLGHFYGGGAK